MGRRIPSPPSLANPSIHPLLSLSLLAFIVASCVAVVSTLCASCHPKPSPPKSPPNPALSSPQSSRSVQKEKPEAAASASAAAEEQKQKPHSPMAPPEETVVLDIDLPTHGPIPPTTVPAERSPKRRLSISLSMSMKLPDGLAKIRTKKEHHGNETSEETLWKKTIILGEKCRVPSEDEEEVAAASGGETSRHKNYHPKTPRSLPVSRTNSFTAAAPPP